ncbi:MAG: Gfo/Idh/MocA family protein [Fusicatenibacter sp.]
MSMSVQFATIGTSKITGKFLEAAGKCEDFRYCAAYSRDRERAKAFAKMYGAVRYYADLEELASDPDVDAVYIASPNHMHHDQAIRLMKAGKHILCEKSIASNAREAAEMMETAEQHRVVLMEAMRPIYDPGFEKIAECLAKIGKIRRVTFRYCQYSSRYDSFREGTHHNIFDRNCSAGSLMDIGVYCVEPMVQLFGVPSEIKAFAVLLEGGIDGLGTILAKYEDMIAELIYSKITDSKEPSEIQGEKGRMLIWNITNPRRIVIRYYDGMEEEYEVPGEENNMLYEIQRFLLAVQQKKQMDDYLKISLESMKIMEEARRQIGVSFPADM